MPDEDRIRRRAHAIWEHEGRPEGREQEHWAQARQEIEAEQSSPSSQAAAPGASPTPATPDDGGTNPGKATTVGAPRNAERVPSEPPPPDPLASEAARIID